MADLYDQDSEFSFADKTHMSVGALPCGCVTLLVEMVEDQEILIHSTTVFYLAECPDDSEGI